jgi:hypothetical protein
MSSTIFAADLMLHGLFAHRASEDEVSSSRTIVRAVLPPLKNSFFMRGGEPAAHGRLF